MTQTTTRAITQADDKIDDGPKSPCISLCAVSAQAGFCIGCGRKLIEISGWSGFSDDEKHAILARLPARLASLKTA